MSDELDRVLEVIDVGLQSSATPIESHAPVRGRLHITEGMRAHQRMLSGQRMYQQNGHWWVWRRIPDPPYTDGAERFRVWKPRHLWAYLCQMAWEWKHW